MDEEKIFIMPTKKESNIYVDKSDGKIYLLPNSKDHSSNLEARHIYITILSSMLKEGDWYIDNYNRLRRYTDNECLKNKKYDKITMSSNLLTLDSISDSETLPLIPEEFVKSYIKEHNEKIDIQKEKIDEMCNYLLKGKSDLPCVELCWLLLNKMYTKSEITPMEVINRITIFGIMCYNDRDTFYIVDYLYEEYKVLFNK